MNQILPKKPETVQDQAERAEMPSCLAKLTFFNLEIPMKTIACSLLALVCLTFSGCYFLFDSGVRGSGVSMSETREVDTFEAIELNGAGTVNVKFGDEQSVDLTIDDNLIELIETKVTDGKLVIEPTESINPKVSLVVEVTVKSLSDIEISGAGKIHIHDMNGGELELTIKGAGSIEGNGTADQLTINVSGAGSANLKDLQAKTVEVDMSGAGSANVYASESFDGNVSGVGKITCYGNPEKKKKNVSGVGKIEIKD